MGEIAGVSRIGAGKLIDRYIVLSHIGVGGIGVVYAAYDPDLDRKVAIKLLRPRGVKRTEQLLREAQAMASLTHPHVVVVHEVGTIHDVVYIAMEPVEGGSLRDWIDAGPRPWPVVVELMQKVGAGLAAAHAVDLIHHHFGPANVLLDRVGDPRITDFGLTRRTDGDAQRSRKIRNPRWFDESTSADSNPKPLTPADRPRASTPTAAPEQYAGEPVDARADQFSFCVTLYEALYGEHPFDGRTHEAVVLAIEEGRVRQDSARAKVPGWLRRVVIRGLAHDPAQRWPSMTALLDALARGPGQHRRRVAASVVSTLAVLAIAVASMRPQLAPEREAPPSIEPRATPDSLARAVGEALAAHDQALAITRILELAQALEHDAPQESLRWLTIGDSLLAQPPAHPGRASLADDLQRARARASARAAQAR